VSREENNGRVDRGAIGTTPVILSGLDVDVIEEKKD
jgi:hypothetical protein